MEIDGWKLIDIMSGHGEVGIEWGSIMFFLTFPSASENHIGLV